MLYSDQEEQILNSDDAPETGDPESVETPEPVSAESESTDSSLQPLEEGVEEPETEESTESTLPEPDATDLDQSVMVAEIADSESSPPADDEEIEPTEGGQEPEPDVVETDDVELELAEDQAAPVEESEPAISPEDTADIGQEDLDEIEADQAEMIEPTEGEPDVVETDDVELELAEDQAAPVEESEPGISSEDTTDIELEDLGEDQADQAEMEEDGRSWYVVHCYSGYENKVRHNLEQRIETMGMKDRIFDIVVPTEEEIEVKEGKRRTVERRVFPGYILVNMVMTEESWYVVRNTPGVTGFVGMGNTPTPLRPEEVSQIIKRMEAEAPRIKVTFKKDERVRIVDGPFNDFRGTVAEIDMERAKVRVMVNFFGRETPVELDFLQVEKT